MRTYRYSDRGFELTKGFEGLRLDAYQDVAGIWTVGYGHTGPDVHPRLKITQATADQMLRSDLASAVDCVNKALTVDVSQEQFDAMADFCFNTGRGHFLSSSLLRFVNAGKFAEAADEFLKWVNAGGKRCAGLVRRRTAERALFLTPQGPVAVDAPSTTDFAAAVDATGLV